MRPVYPEEAVDIWFAPRNFLNSPFPNKHLKLNFLIFLLLGTISNLFFFANAYWFHPIKTLFDVSYNSTFQIHPEKSSFILCLNKERIAI